MVCKAGAGRVLPRRTEEEGASTQAPHHHNTMIPPPAPANPLTSASDVLQQASRRLCGGGRGEVGLIVVFVGDGAESGERRSFFAHSVGPRFPRPLPLSSHMAALRATAAALVGVGAVLTARRRGERGRGKGNDWRARRSPPPRPPPLLPPVQRTATLRAMLGRRQLRPTQTCLFKTHPPPFPFPHPSRPPALPSPLRRRLRMRPHPGAGGGGGRERGRHLRARRRQSGGTAAARGGPAGGGGGGDGGR